LLNLASQQSPSKPLQLSWNLFAGSGPCQQEPVMERCTESLGSK
jgi:hypothetical protein